MPYPFLQPGSQGLSSCPLACSRARGLNSIMDNVERCRPKGVHFSGWRHIKGRDFMCGSIEKGRKTVIFRYF